MAGRRIFVAAASLATLVFAATQATGAITKSSEQVAIGPFPDRDTAEAQCQRGKRVVSGGFSTPTWGFVDDQTRISPASSRKTGGRTWSSFAFNGDPDTAGTFTGYAYCDGDAPRLRQRTAETEIGESARVRAACRSRQRLVSGGFSVPTLGDDEAVRVTESRKSGQGWAATAEVTSGSNQTLVAHAYCARRAPKLKRVRATENVGTGPLEHSESARCPRRRPVVSGGFHVPTEGVVAIGIHESRRKGRRAWLASSYTFAAASGELLTVEAYCGPKLP